MTKQKKKYLLGWGMAGAAVPILLLVVGFFLPKTPPRNPFEETQATPTQERLALIATILYPAMYPEMLLGLVEMDAGVDSTINGWILFAISVVLNSGVYVLFGLLIWPLAVRLSNLRRRAPS